MVFMAAEKNEFLDATTINQVSLHHGDPGTDGSNEIDSGTTGYERKTVAWNPAGDGVVPDGEKRNNGDVVFNVDGGKGNDSKVAWLGLWETTGGTFRGKAQVTEETYGADGTYTLEDDSGLRLKQADS